MSNFSIDVTDASFEQDVLEASKDRPVLVDFWAPWCGPCRSLKPVLEKLAQEYQGKFVLAKLNSDENPDVSSQFGIRSIPNVKAFVGGKEVDEFMGAVPESQVRRFIEGLLPSPSELLRQEAGQALEDGNTDSAITLLDQAVMLDPRNDNAHADRAQALLQAGRIDDAQHALQRLSPFGEQDARIGAIVAKVGFAANAGTGNDVAKLREKVTGNPTDMEARFALANQLVLDEEFESALEQLLEIVKRDRKFGDDAGRKTMLSVFSLMTQHQDVVRRYRQLLSAALN